MNFFVTGIQAAYNFLLFFLYCRTLHQLLTPKRGSYSFYLLLSLVNLVLIMSFLTPANAFALRDFMLFSTILIVAYVCYEEHILWTLVCICTLFLGVALPEGIAMFILTYIFHLSTAYVIQELYIIWVPLITIFTLLCFHLLKKILRLFKYSISKSSHAAQWIIVLFGVNNISIPSLIIIAQNDQIILCVYIILNIIGFYACYRLFHQYHSHILKKQADILSKQQLSECLQSSDERTKQLQYLRHEFMNDLQILSILMKEEQENAQWNG